MFLLKSFVSSLYLIRASSVRSCCSTFETGWSITPWAWDLPSYKPWHGQMIQPRNWGAVSSLRSKHSLMANGARRHDSRFTPLLSLSLPLPLSLSLVEKSHACWVIFGGDKSNQCGNTVHLTKLQLPLPQPFFPLTPPCRAGPSSLEYLMLCFLQ